MRLPLACKIKSFFIHILHIKISFDKVGKSVAPCTLRVKSTFQLSQGRKTFLKTSVID